MGGDWVTAMRIRLTLRDSTALKFSRSAWECTAAETAKPRLHIHQDRSGRLPQFTALSGGIKRGVGGLNVVEVGQVYPGGFRVAGGQDGQVEQLPSSRLALTLILPERRLVVLSRREGNEQRLLAS